MGCEVAAKFADWLKTLPIGPLEFISQDCGLLDGIEGRRVVAPPALAGAIARIALSRFEKGTAQDPATLEANYVRRPDIR